MASSRRNPNNMEVSLGPLKSRFSEWCKTKNKKPSEVIRELICREIGEHSENTHPFQIDATVRDGEASSQKFRRVLRLTPSEDRAVCQMAELEGYSPQRWIVALIRARLTGAPEFNESEVQALVKSTTQVAAIGRNLNQIAKALNANPNEAKYFRVEVISEVSKLINEHLHRTSALIAANVDRWKIT